MAIKFVHTADIHIGMKFDNSSFKGKIVSKRLKDIKDTFSNIIEFTNDYKADLLFISGDLFNSNNIKKTDAIFIINELNKLNTTKVFITAGNHDPLTKESYYNLLKFPSNTYIFKNKIEKVFIKELNAVIHGYSFDNPYIEKDIITSKIKRDEDKINILLLHGDVFTKKSKYLPLNKIDLGNLDFNYIALGHIHKHQFITKNIVYPGSPEPFDFSETGEHGIVYGEISKDKTISSFKKTQKRSFIVHKIDLKDSTTEHSISNTILDSFTDKEKTNDLIRVVLTGSYDFNIDLDITQLHDSIEDVFFHIEIQNKASKNFDLKRIQLEYKDTIVSDYIQHFKTSNKTEENELALQLGLSYLLKGKEH